MFRVIQIAEGSRIDIIPIFSLEDNVFKKLNKNCMHKLNKHAHWDLKILTEELLKDGIFLF